MKITKVLTVAAAMAAAAMMMSCAGLSAIEDGDGADRAAGSRLVFTEPSERE